MKDKVAPGVSTKFRLYAEKLIREMVISSFFKLSSAGAKTPFPASLCVSINDEWCMGFRVKIDLKEGILFRLIWVLNTKIFLRIWRLPCRGKISPHFEAFRITEQACKWELKCEAGGTVGDIG